MRYVVHVIAAFAADKEMKSFDIWEIGLRFAADGPREALAYAVSRSRAILDDADNLRALGYPAKPTFYGVKSVYSDVDLPRRTPDHDSECALLTKTVTFDEEQMERVKSFDEVAIPFGIMFAG
jgi:hypothetical protein